MVKITTRVRMGRTARIVGAVVLLTAQCWATEQALTIGAKATAGVRRHSRHKMCMTHSSQLDPCSDEIISGIKYRIAYRQDTGKVSYISTDDALFRTEDGLRVGSTLDVTRDQVQAFPGWEIRGPKGTDGWRPLFGIGAFGITVVQEGRDIQVTADRNEELLDKVFAESQIVMFRIIGFVQSR